LENAFAKYEPAEIVALLSCFVFQERSDSPPQLTQRLEEGCKKILSVAERVAEAQAECGLPIQTEDYLASFKFNLVEVVFEWARGMVRIIIPIYTLPMPRSSHTVLFL
jgi:antiviral helicase SKI2